MVDVNSEEYKASRARAIEAMVREWDLVRLEIMAANPMTKEDLRSAAENELKRRKSLPGYRFMD